MSYQCQCGVIVTTTDGLCPNCAAADKLRSDSKKGWATTVMQEGEPKFLQFCNRVMSLLFEDSTPIGRDKPFAYSRYAPLKEKIAQAQTLAFQHGATATETAREIAKQFDKFQ